MSLHSVVSSLLSHGLDTKDILNIVVNIFGDNVSIKQMENIIENMKLAQPLEPSNKIKLNYENNKSQITENSENLTILVVDKVKEVSRKFICAEKVITAQMGYFARNLPKERKSKKIDISVHCDVDVFEFLLEFALRNFNGEEITLAEVSSKSFNCLDVKNLISVMISAEFLKMELLIDLCVEQFCANIESFIAAKYNLNCINDDLLSRISGKFSALEIEAITDEGDKIKSRMFYNKVQELFKSKYRECAESASTLFKCCHCKKWLTKRTAELFQCTAQRYEIGERGNLLYFHQIEEEWDLNFAVANLKKELGWREVYWRIWSIVNFFYCSKCGKYFPCFKFKRCLCHRKEIDKRTQLFRCCGERAVLFDGLNGVNGCDLDSHVVEFEGSENIGKNELYQIMMSCKENVFDYASSKRDFELLDVNVAFKEKNDKKLRKQDQGRTNRLIATSVEQMTIYQRLEELYFKNTRSK